jgi:hypothetical protein
VNEDSEAMGATLEDTLPGESGRASVASVAGLAVGFSASREVCPKEMEVPRGATISDRMIVLTEGRKLCLKRESVVLKAIPQLMESASRD